MGWPGLNAIKERSEKKLIASMDTKKKNQQNRISHLLLAPTQILIHGQRYIQANVVTLSLLYHVLLEHEFSTINF